MKTLVRSILFAGLFLVAVPLHSQDAEGILKKVKAQFDKVHDYSATLTATVNMERINIPPMQLKVYFKQPNKVHIESKNFAMLPREGFALNPTDLLTNFDATIEETTREEGSTVYRLRLVSKPVPNRPVRESRIWVDGNRWVITRLETSPMEGRTIEIRFEYATVQSEYILPSLMEASFDFSQGDDDTAARRGGHVRMPSKGSVEVKYSEYVVNKGLSDEIFEKKEKKE
jgi:outer membrane lipoprotein-sorting protein